jgi:multiple RNA-binding domain-containing protein 1
MFNEFIESHMKEESSVWKNDVLLSLNDEDEASNNTESNDDESESEDSDSSVKKPIAKKDITDKQYMEALKKKSNGSNVEITKEEKVHGPHKFFTVKIQGLAYNHKKKDIKQFFKGFKAKSIRVPNKIKGIAYVGFKTERQMKLALNKNKSFLGIKFIISFHFQVIFYIIYLR